MVERIFSPFSCWNLHKLYGPWLVFRQFCQLIGSDGLLYFFLLRLSGGEMWATRNDSKLIPLKFHEIRNLRSLARYGCVICHFTYPYTTNLCSFAHSFAPFALCISSMRMELSSCCSDCVSVCHHSSLLLLLLLFLFNCFGKRTTTHRETTMTTRTK